MSSKSTSSILGTPIKLQSIEIAQHDFPDEMDRQEAIIACETLGEGWRLPTKEELNTIYLNKKQIGGFKADKYWSSSEHDNQDYGWAHNFDNGHEFYNYKELTYNVRAVKSL